MRNLLFLVAGALVILSCQSVEIVENKNQCTQMDWFEIGRSDGVQGLQSMAYESKKDSCEGFSKNEHEKYVAGWYAGVDEFCQGNHGFSYGRSGKKYLNICPPSREDNFLRHYRKGMKVFLYEKDNQRITDELQKITDNASKAEGDRAPALVKKMTELETRLELNKALISEIQKEIDETATF